MAFTRALDDSVPNGALVNASQIDDEIRKVRVDYHERLSSLFENPDIDPSVIKSQVSLRVNAATGKVRYDGSLTGDTYSYESSANVLDDIVGGVNVFRRSATGAIVTGTLNVSGTITGNLAGNVTGNITGNVTGNVTGNLTGNVTGNVTGNTSGSAATLLNTRTIWGQNFNGSGNVSGALSGATTGDFSGIVTIGGLLDLSGASAGQIKFPATQNSSANANTLDDHERGSWLPTPGGTAVLGTQKGKYVKNGRSCTIWGNFYITTIGSGNDSQISGIPFTAASSQVSYPVLISYWGGLHSTQVWVVGEIADGGTVIKFNATNAIDRTTIPFVATNLLDDTTAMRFMCTYETAT